MHVSVADGVASANYDANAAVGIIWDQWFYGINAGEVPALKTVIHVKMKENPKFRKVRGAFHIFERVASTLGLTDFDGSSTVKDYNRDLVFSYCAKKVYADEYKFKISEDAFKQMKCSTVVNHHNIILGVIRSNESLHSNDV